MDWSLYPADCNGCFLDVSWKKFGGSIPWEDLVFEPKYDGGRYLLHLHSKGNHLTSRRISEKTGRYVDKIKQVYRLDALADSSLNGTVIDGEVVSKKFNHSSLMSLIGCKPRESIKKQKAQGDLFMFAFDILFFAGKDIRYQPFKKRRKALLMAIDALKSDFLVAAPQFRAFNQKEADYIQKCNLGNGFEGSMVKHAGTKYGAGMWKWKVQRTTDVIISGFTEADFGVTGKYDGLIGAVVGGVYKGDKLVEVCQCSGMTDELRRKFSKNRSKLMGEVMEVEFQEMTVQKRLRHPRFVRLRPDYPKHKVVWSKLLKDVGKV